MKTDFSLIVIGAYDGSKLDQFIKVGSNLGQVLLVEPLDFFCKKLSEKYQSKSIMIKRAAIIIEDLQQIKIYRPKVIDEADIESLGLAQLTSVNKNHATAHSPDLDQKFSEENVPATDFRKLLIEYKVNAIHTLILDTEGLDAKLLESFSFDQVKPRRIFFEFKHSDGPFRVGKNLANLLFKLVDMGYQIKPIDAENMEANLILAP